MAPGTADCRRRVTRTCPFIKRGGIGEGTCGRHGGVPSERCFGGRIPDTPRRRQCVYRRGPEPGLVGVLDQEVLVQRAVVVEIVAAGGCQVS